MLSRSNNQTEKALKWASLLKTYWPKLKDSLVKTILLKFLPRFISGPWGWVVSIVLGSLVDYALKPAYEMTVRKIIVFIRSKEMKKKGEAHENSQTEDDFDSTFDDLP